jgi:hypothetical protein
MNLKVRSNCSLGSAEPFDPELTAEGLGAGSTES